MCVKTINEMMAPATTPAVAFIEKECQKRAQHTGIL
jgi:hypothetical protein